ncbi:hypothetical protein LTR53_014757 [Teratosphaeriaceae sp. CCFEE 6253]|nr:hypothetical protein LTR53_014757 [Teratosphaeriaceae sp. CCFEE 6253]
MTLLGGHHKSAELQQELRETRRALKERIRNDWDFPPLPAYQRATRRPERAPSSGGEEARVAGFRFHVRKAHAGKAPSGSEAEVTEWRERVLSSDSGSDADSGRTSDSKSSSRSKKSEYVFEGPDSVGAQVQDRRSARKLKRQRRAQDELGWNEGLNHWTCQRDLWTGARPSDGCNASRQRARHGEESSTGSAGSAESTPRTSTSSTLAELSSAATTPEVGPTASPAPATGFAHITSPADVMIPVCAPILPDHPIRRRISPPMYHEIYSKIILQGRTPSVPINLGHLVSALIEGWKADGEWPPKSTAPLEPSIGKRKAKVGGSVGSESSLKSGVKAVGRVLRLTGTSEASGQKARDAG